MSLKLYFAPNTRATRPRWLLEELAVPYELVRLDMKAKEHKSPAYLAVHPHGVVPALDDDGTIILESGAILAHLADKLIEKGFAPPFGSAERAKYYQWLFYASATMEPAITGLLAVQSKGASDGAAHEAEKEREARAKWTAVTTTLEAALVDKPYLLGPSIRACDIAVGSALTWASALKLVEGRAVLLDYVSRLKSRPAYQAARREA